VLATEVTEAGVEAATTALRDCPQVKVRLANLFDGGSPASLEGEAPFDLILVSEVLEHIDDDLSALRTIWDLLSDDGLLVVTVPRDPEFWSVEDELWDHKRRYTRSDLLSKFRTADFRTTRLWTWGFPVTKQIVRYQISRLKPESEADRDTTPPTMRPPALLLPVARLTFNVIARVEQAFKNSDRGIGYIAAARKSATKTD
jgi:SAM-dependent methyltransferase